jgi:hypothetical protein
LIAIEACLDWARENVRAIAMGDGFVDALGEEAAQWVAQRAVNWKQSALPKDQEETGDAVIPAARSAGTDNHTLVLYEAADCIWRFFEQMGPLAG